MLNKENLLSIAGDAPEPGYIKAKLTIGAWGSLFSLKRGYLRGEHGSLEPNKIGSKSIANLYVVSRKITEDVPFYYNNVKYTDGSTTETLFDEWSALKDQTVDIWLGGGKNPTLARIIGLLWRTA